MYITNVWRYVAVVHIIGDSESICFLTFNIKQSLIMTQIVFRAVENEKSSAPTTVVSIRTSLLKQKRNTLPMTAQIQARLRFALEPALFSEALQMTNNREFTSVHTLRRTARRDTSVHTLRRTARRETVSTWPAPRCAAR
jgi:hypothetical protein